MAGQPNDKMTVLPKENRPNPQKSIQSHSPSTSAAAVATSIGEHYPPPSSNRLPRRSAIVKLRYTKSDIDKFRRYHKSPRIRNHSISAAQDKKKKLFLGWLASGAPTGVTDVGNGTQGHTLSRSTFPFHRSTQNDDNDDKGMGPSVLRDLLRGNVPIEECDVCRPFLQSEGRLPRPLLHVHCYEAEVLIYSRPIEPLNQVNDDNDDEAKIDPRLRRVPVPLVTVTPPSDGEGGFFG